RRVRPRRQLMRPSALGHSPAPRRSQDPLMAPTLRVCNSLGTGLGLGLGLALVVGCTDYRDPNGDEDAESAVTLNPSDDTDSDSETTEGEGCRSDAECADHPNGPVCDEAINQCFPECEPGDTGQCYDGPPATLGVGLCAGGTRTC